ncbi:hypothetical protein HK102_002412 [Quaeritorhiza haematococci]|nr:hypothetical protein HK102_002412 [Quaeritorhiza haematococci]
MTTFPSSALRRLWDINVATLSRSVQCQRNIPLARHKCVTLTRRSWSSCSFPKNNTISGTSPTAALSLPFNSLNSTKSLKFPSTATRASFHTSTVQLSRFPKVTVRVTRRAKIRHVRKQKRLQARLGARYRELKKLPDSIPKPTPPEPKLRPFLATPENTTPEPIIPGDLEHTVETFQKRRAEQLASEEAQAAQEKEQRAAAGGGIRLRLTRQNASENLAESQSLKFDASAVPTSIPSKAPLPKGVAVPEGASLPDVQSEGPYYSYSLRPSDVNFLLRDTPEAVRNVKGEPEKVDQQAEMVRRIISLDNASAEQMRAFNKQRTISLMARTVNDTGSSEVQAGIFTVKIEAMKKHLATHPKDIGSKRTLEIWMSKRMKILKYLRRKDLKKYVETCKLIGVEPDTIRA